MISGSTRNRAQNLCAFRCTAATALFLSAILGASVALANKDFRYGSPDAAPPASGSAAPAPGGSAAPPAGASTSLKTCDPGLVWDTKKKKCIIKRSGVLPDGDLIEYAYALAKAERYQEALDVLDILDDPNTARALNYRGYATRKLGRTEEGISYYLRSVALDPTYTQVREYLGEAYVTLGKFDLAKEQLATIEKLCGSKDCENYVDLAAALEKAHGL
jgi:tetratricopeptide (TPR) repeat protein